MAYNGINRFGRGLGFLNTTSNRKAAGSTKLSPETILKNYQANQSSSSGKVDSSDNSSQKTQASASELYSKYNGKLKDLETSGKEFSSVKWDIPELKEDGSNKEEVEAQKKAVYKAVSGLADAYNSAVKFMDDHSSRAAALKTLSESFVKAVQELPADTGISVTKNGKITVDEDAFLKALAENPEKLKEAVTGGLAKAASEQLSAAQKAQKEVLNGLLTTKNPSSSVKDWFEQSSGTSWFGKA